MSQTDLNTVQSEKESDPNDFRTPWQKRLFGKEEQLIFNRNPNGFVQVKIVSKTVAHDVFQQIAGLFGKKSEPIETRRLEFERAYGNVSVERFESEKKEIQKLLDKHTSLNAILRQIEKDLKNPNLLPEEVAQRQESLTKMRADISALMAQIDEAEASPELQSYEELKSSIERIKQASQIAFLKISNFQNRIKDPAISISQLEELTKEISQLKANNSIWNKDFEIVRKTLSIEKESLQAEIKKFTDQLQSLPDDLKKPWDELTAKWKKPSTLTSSAEIQQYRQEMVKVIEQITEQYHKAFNSKINASIVELQRNLDATNPDFSNPEKQQDHLDFRAQILAYRKGSWMSLNDLWNHSEHNSEAVGTLQKCIQQEQIIDYVLVNTLEINPEEENYIEKFLSFIAPITSFITPLISELPLINMFQQHDILAAKERFDNTALFYINQTFGKISSTINSLAELIPYEETDELIAKYNDLLADESVMQSDLNAYLDEVIALAQTAIRSDNDEFDQHHINAAIFSLQGQKEILSIIIKAQQKHAETIIKKIKDEYPAAFDKNARPSILDTANATIDEILPEDNSNYDFKGLSTDWQQNRAFLAEQLDTIKHLETLESLQKEFQETAKKREKEIASLTGEEKLQAEEILQDLKETIDSLDENLEMDSADDTMSYSYRTKLSKINHDFIPIFEIENRKKEMRFHLNQTIDAFTSHLDQCNKAIETLEKHYSISLENARELVKDKLESIKEWKEQGQLPSAYLKYAPAPALSALLYYAPDKLSFEEAKVTDLNLSDLSFYIDNLQAVINNHKNELSSHRILESTFALKAFQDASKQLDIQAKNLMSGITVKTNFSGDQQYQISEGLSTSNLSKLQFHNATLIAERQNKLINHHKKAISDKPDLKFIYQKLNNDTDELTNILEQSQKGQNLSLLDQIQKLEHYPERQELAKKAFIETITTKLSEHTKTMIDQIKMFKAYPKIQEEAVRQLQRTEADFFKRLSTAPEVLQYHAEGWKVLRDGKLNFSTKSDLDVQSLSTSELKNYLDAIDKMITQGSDYLKLVKNNYDKVEQASKKFQDKIKEAKTTLNSLNNKDQVIEMERLQSIVSRAEKMKNDFMAASETKEDEFFPVLSFFMTPSKNTNPTQAAIRILDGYKKNIGDSISKIDAAVKKAKQSPILTIPQQLELNPNSKTAEELRSRFQNQMRPLIQSTRQDLEQYRNGQSSVAYIRYVSHSSSLMSDIERAINSKLDELDRFEKGYYSNGLFDRLTHPFTPIPLSEMNSKQMADYQRQLTRLESVMKEDLNKKFQITSLIDAQYAYEKKNEAVIKQLSKLREKELFTEAFLLERKVEEIAKKEAKWVEKVTQPGQLRALVADLKKFDREIDFALSEHHPKKTAASYESQITQLLERKKEFSKLLSSWLEPKNQEILDQINADIAMLKTKLASKIDKGFSEHQDKLIKLKHDIEEIFSTYNIKFQSKDAIISAIDDEISKFESDNKFDASQYQFLEKLFNPGLISNSLKYVTTTKKNIEEMDPEEIVQLRPEKKLQALIDNSFKKISDSFNYKVILEPHKAYLKALEEAEKTQSELIQKDQFIHANTLEEKVNKIKNDHEKWATKEINNSNEILGLSRAITEMASKLKNAKSNAVSQQDMDIEDQINQIDDIDAKSPHRERLRNSIVSNIQKTLEKQNTLKNKYIGHLDNLVKHIGLPYNWREKIVSELDKCQEEFEKLSSDLITNYSKEATKKIRERDVVQDTVDEWGEAIQNQTTAFEENHPYITAAGKFALQAVEATGEKLAVKAEKLVLPTNRAKESVLQAGDNLTKFISKTNDLVTQGVKVGYSLYNKLYNKDFELPLSELDLADLIAIQKKLKSEENQIKEMVNKYGLKTLREQLKNYENKLTSIESIKTQRIKDFHPVEDLDNLILVCEAEFELFYENKSVTNLHIHMKNLSDEFKRITAALSSSITNIKKVDPPTLGESLQKLSEDSQDYKSQKKTIRKQILAKITEQKKNLSTYFKKIETINNDIISKIPDCPILPINWKNAIEDIIKEKLIQLDELACGLPIKGDGTYDSKPYETLTKSEIWEYEKIVNHHTSKKEDLTNPTSVLGKLEKLTRLKGLEKYFTNFQKATKKLETKISQPNILEEKKIILEAIKTTIHRLVFSCIQNIEFLDSGFLEQTLDLGQAILFRASDETAVGVTDIDPWSTIYLIEEKTTIKYDLKLEQSIENIITNGFVSGYKSPTEGPQVCTFTSIKATIEETKKHLEERKNECENILAFLRKRGYENHPKFQEITHYITKTIPQIKTELTLLETKIPIKKHGAITGYLKIDEIKKVDDLLTYKNYLEKLRSKFFDEIYRITDVGHLYEEKPLPAQSNETGLGGTNGRDQDDFVDISSDSTNSSPEISKKEKSSVHVDSSSQSSTAHLTEEEILRSQISSLQNTIKTFADKCNKKINFISKEFNFDLKSIVDIIKKEIDYLNEKLKCIEISSENIKSFEQIKQNTFDVIYDQTLILEAYIESKKFKKLKLDIEKKIQDLCLAQQYTTIQKLQSNLEKAKTLTVVNDFKNFTQNIALINAELRKNLKDADSPVDNISQISQTLNDDKHYEAIAKTILKGLQENVKVFKNNSDMLSTTRKIPLPLCENLKQIQIDLNASIKEAENVINTKEKFTEKVNQIRNKINESLEILDNIKKSMNLLNNTCLEKGVLDKHFEKAKTISAELNKLNPRNHFYICKIEKLKNDLNNSAQKFIDCYNRKDNSNDYIENFIENSNQFEISLKLFENCVNKMEKPPKMTLFEQLELCKIEPGILSSELEKQMIDAIKKSGYKIIEETTTYVGEYCLFAKRFSDGAFSSNIPMIMENAVTSENKFKREIKDVTDSTKLRQWISAIRKEQMSIINNLDNILHYPANKENWDEYNLLIKEANSLLHEIGNTNSRSAIELREAIQNLNTAEQQLFNNLNDLKDFWKNLKSSQWSDLQNKVANIKEDLKK